jgi:hypothetical protein
VVAELGLDPKCYCCWLLLLLLLLLLVLVLLLLLVQSTTVLTHDVVGEVHPYASRLILECIQELAQVAHGPVHLILAITITLCCCQPS